MKKLKSKFFRVIAKGVRIKRKIQSIGEKYIFKEEREEEMKLTKEEEEYSILA